MNPDEKFGNISVALWKNKIVLKILNFFNGFLLVLYINITMPLIYFLFKNYSSNELGFKFF